MIAPDNTELLRHLTNWGTAKITAKKNPVHLPGEHKYNISFTKPMKVLKIFQVMQMI